MSTVSKPQTVEQINQNQVGQILVRTMPEQAAALLDDLRHERDKLKAALNEGIEAVNAQTARGGKDGRLQQWAEEAKKLL